MGGIDTPIEVKMSADKPNKGKGKGDDSYGPMNGGKGGGEDGPYGKGKGGGKGRGTDGCEIRTLVEGIVQAGVYPGAPAPGVILPDEHQVRIVGLPADTQNVDIYKMFSPFA